MKGQICQQVLVKEAAVLDIMISSCKKYNSIDVAFYSSYFIDWPHLSRISCHVDYIDLQQATEENPFDTSLELEP